MNRAKDLLDLVETVTEKSFVNWLVRVAKRVRKKAAKRFGDLRARCKEVNGMLKDELEQIRKKDNFNFRVRMVRGFFNTRERSLAHFYLLVTDSDLHKSYIVDIAADQYGCPEVVVTDPNDPRYE